LNAADFDWRRDYSEATQYGPGQDADTVDVLVHTPTGFHFKFDVQQPRGSLWAFYNPGPEGVPRRDHAGGWDQVWAYFGRWLGQVAEEHAAPDLWATLRQQADVIVGEAVANTPFTLDEQAQVTAQLTEAKEYVRANLELEPAQLDRIEAQLDYLIDASRRVGRIDWRNLFVGSFLSLVIQGVVPVLPIQQVLFVVLHGLAALFGGGTPLLPGAPRQLL
jgi:hypothetical protein